MPQGTHRSDPKSSKREEAENELRPAFVQMIEDYSEAAKLHTRYTGGREPDDICRDGKTRVGGTVLGPHGSLSHLFMRRLTGA
jgi:hypothetical protein